MRKKNELKVVLMNAKYYAKGTVRAVTCKLCILLHESAITQEMRQKRRKIERFKRKKTTTTSLLLLLSSSPWEP